jgi:hypothetical protein
VSLRKCGKDDRIAILYGTEGCFEGDGSLAHNVSILFFAHEDDLVFADGVVNHEGEEQDRLVMQ